MYLFLMVFILITMYLYFYHYENQIYHIHILILIYFINLLLGSRDNYHHEEMLIFLGVLSLFMGLIRRKNLLCLWLNILLDLCRDWILVCCIMCLIILLLFCFLTASSLLNIFDSFYDILRREVLLLCCQLSL